MNRQTENEYSMKCSECWLTVFVLGTSLLFVGCESSASNDDNDRQVDSGDGHRHQHGSDQSGQHTHGHQHGEPLYGGRLVAIGHTHHGTEATHYHAEIIPIRDGQLAFHVLTQNTGGNSEPLRVEATKIVAYVDRTGKQSTRAEEVAFVSEQDPAGSKFVAPVPESLLDCQRLLVVVPKIQLGGERLSFSFTTSKPEVPLESEANVTKDVSK